MARLSQRMQNAQVATEANAREKAIAARILSEYPQQKGMFAFSYNAAQGTDTTATIYPTIAWWDGHASLRDADAAFARWASGEFSTDWGTRDVGEHEAIYDGISYHQGSVWPLFTGWTAVAEYRTGRTLSGYAHLMQTANLTTAQDLGAVTELLSGDYFVPFGRSTTHQLWSSAMVLIPAVRGLFGVTPDAAANKLTIDPRLPAQWDHATLHNLRLGAASVDLDYQRTHEGWLVRAQTRTGAAVKLASGMPGAQTSREGRELRIPGPAVEVGMDYVADGALPLPGARTSMLKVLDQQSGPRTLTLTLEAQGGSQQSLVLRQNRAQLHLTADGGAVSRERLTVDFPAGTGYVRKQVTLRW